MNVGGMLSHSVPPVITQSEVIYRTPDISA
jgi:hypothetical protein